jgi:uncharacterized membrane protein
MESKFSIPNVLRTSWKALIPQIWILAGLLIGYALLSLILASVLSPLLSSSWVGGIIVNLVSLIIGLVFSLGYVKNLFQALDGDEPRFSAYGQQARKIGTYFVSNLLYGILVCVIAALFLVPYFYLLYHFSFIKDVFVPGYAPVIPEGGGLPLFFMGIGALCLLLPSVYFGIRFTFYQAFIVEDDAGIVESLGKSWEITKGQELPLFLLGLIMIGISIVGILVFLIGIFVATPLIWLMHCCVFRKLNKYSSRPCEG